MPETAMDEYRGTMLCQNDIRFSGQFRTMQPEAETGPVKGFAKADFGRGVLSADARHHAGAGICIHDVGQRLRPFGRCAT